MKTRKERQTDVLTAKNMVYNCQDDFWAEMYVAVNNFEMDDSKLYVSECFVCAGPTLKRIMPRAKGSADRILKRTSHVTMVVKERD